MTKGYKRVEATAAGITTPLESLASDTSMLLISLDNSSDGFATARHRVVAACRWVLLIHLALLGKALTTRPERREHCIVV
jgi:hypothetical protein